jgi:hypothetical protein
MAKSGLTFANLTGVLRQRAETTGWTLCVGAGTSYPLFPNWRAMVSALVEKDVGAAATTAVMPELAMGFGLDTLVQAARDRLDLPSEAFAQLLSDQLYADAKRRLTKEEWALFTRGLASLHPGDMPPATWRKFSVLMTTYFPSVSAISLADVVVASSKVGLGPAAILSFNAEPLLYSLINARSAVGLTRADNPKAVLNRITRSLSHRTSGRISYAFCHGVLPFDGSQSFGWHSVDKLVFSESEYLQVANSGFTWQSSTFFEACMARSAIFIGLSFSDPNLRRWLGIMHQNRLHELQSIGQDDVTSAPHYWFRTAPKTSEERLWTESAVAHLGVRLVWLKNWGDVGPALRRMLSM